MNAAFAPASNPLLDTVGLPRFRQIAAEQIDPALTRLIADHQSVVGHLASSRPTTFDAAWMPLERADVALDALWSTVAHVHAVADTPALRDAYARGQAQLTENRLAVCQNSALYEVFRALEMSPTLADAPEADRAAVARALRDSRLAGVALPAEQQTRLRELQVELSTLSSDFASAVLDATEAWSEAVTDEALLAGISNSDKAMLAAAAREQGCDGWLVTLHRPSVNAILRFAENRDLRFRVYQANATRASDQGPQAKQFDNGPRIARILQCRREAAALLGFANHVERSLATKMAPDEETVLAFLRDLASRARPFALAEVAELNALAVERFGIADLQPWDVEFLSDRLRHERYDIDEQAVRAYFPIDRVLAGWTALLGRLFSIRLIERADVERWHEDVRYFDVADERGEVFGGLYLDLHARSGKRGGAWMAGARGRIRDVNRSGDPIAYLTCNFASAGEDMPALISHEDVQTLLHETGHCLHHVFTEVDRPAIAGTSSFEWDAVELPSQVMEDFAWDRDVLAAMSGHYRTGEPLPAAMFEKLRGARQFQSGLAVLRQIEFALFDLTLHLGDPGADPHAVLETVRDEVAVLRPPRWNRFAHSFSHIFAGSYAAGYYSYLWAEVLAADAFALFVEHGTVSRATGDALRSEVLSRGAVRPAAEVFRAFRGRDPDAGAMLRRRGLTERPNDQEPFSRQIGGNDNA